MAVVQNPVTGSKKIVKMGSVTYLTLVRHEGWKDVTPPRSEKQVAHQKYWRDSGQLQNLHNQLQHVLNHNVLLDDLARVYLSNAINSCNYCLEEARRQRQQEPRYGNRKTKDNG